MAQDIQLPAVEGLIDVAVVTGFLELFDSSGRAIDLHVFCHGFLFLAGTSVLADVFPLPQLADYREAWMLSGVAVAGAWIGCRGVVLRFTGVKEDKQDQQVRR
jgi:hypothetical protein